MGKIITRLYLYDRDREQYGYKGENKLVNGEVLIQDFSPYILQGNGSTDNLDDTLDRAEVTLAGLPFRKEFAPKTKFILERLMDGETEANPQNVMHLCVSSDTVEQPILSDDHYFNHRISFIEAAVEAQSRLVDNIAITYKLKDVSLDEKPTYDPSALATVSVSNVESTTEGTFVQGNYEARIGHRFIWQESDVNTWKEQLLNPVLERVDPSDENSAFVPRTLEIPIPMLNCYFGAKNTKSFSLNGKCSVVVTVTKRNLTTNTVTTTTTEYNPSGSWTNDWAFTTGGIVYNAGIYPPSTNGFIVGRVYGEKYTPAGQSIPSPRIIQQLTRVADYSNPSSSATLNIPLEVDCEYTVSAKRKVFTSAGIALNNSYYISQPDYYSYTGVRFSVTNDNRGLSSDNPALTMKFRVWGRGVQGKPFTREAPPANAYDLFQKAQMTTQNIVKIDGIPCDETPTTFYLDETDITRLKNTEIIENFYNQKNLWELQMEIGKYIHARPKIMFGTDNRFIVKWKQYGLTAQYTDEATKVSIFNSRFVEEYVAMCSSYIANMVQSGGQIKERVVAKSSSENFLVYNDVAEIIVSKPIIEILNVSVYNKSGSQSADITQYIYEQNVYKLLGVQATIEPNKGLALYYTLGDNKIVGLNYRLPTINTGDADNDYAFKRVLGTAFGLPANTWKDLRINDYVFSVTYRTKDTLRADQTRPDLRKYLLSSKYDTVPMHSQFNNQQDIVIDSLKFGQNLYGKLIRTGNAVYEKLEWVTDLAQLKHSGELYNLETAEGKTELYYVAKVENTYYAEHIVSRVEFSKDFNRLSQIIGIPSEPRFYEISEQSLIRREVAVDKFLVLGTAPQVGDDTIDLPTFCRILFANEQDTPQYAITYFKNDIQKPNIEDNGSFIERICSPVCTYSVGSTLTMEWDMADNFSAGDQVISTNGFLSQGNIDTAYNSLKATRYADIFGRADLVDFVILRYLFNIGNNEIAKLPLSPYWKENNKSDDVPQDWIVGTAKTHDINRKNVEQLNSNKHGLVLLKDNREAISINVNICMLTDSDRFVLSQRLWDFSKGETYLAFLRTEVNKLSNDVIDGNEFDAEGVVLRPLQISQQIEYTSNYIRVKVRQVVEDWWGDEAAAQVGYYKSLAIVTSKQLAGGARYFVAARNIADLTTADECFADWYISTQDKAKYRTEQTELQ